MNKRLGGAAAAAIVCAGALAIGWHVLRDARPGRDAPPEAVAAFVATDAFGKLPAAEREAYVRRLADLSPGARAAAFAAAGLSPDRREIVLEAIYSAQPANPIEQFAMLRTAAERRAYLDRLIDAGGARDGDSSPWDSAARKRMLERTSPEERVRLAEFVGAFNQRRRERGLGPAVP